MIDRTFMSKSTKTDDAMPVTNTPAEAPAHDDLLRREWAYASIGEILVELDRRAATITRLTADNERLRAALDGLSNVTALGNLLAVIHRDGGHHTEAVGVEQSVADAHKVWAGLIGSLEEIGRQKLHAEITDTDPDELDWLGGYELCVLRARVALNQEKTDV
jgi:vancomycin resistance protein YoaR